MRKAEQFDADELAARETRARDPTPTPWRAPEVKARLAVLKRRERPWLCMTLAMVFLAALILVPRFVDDVTTTGLLYIEASVAFLVLSIWRLRHDRIVAEVGLKCPSCGDEQTKYLLYRGQCSRCSTSLLHPTELEPMPAPLITSGSKARNAIGLIQREQTLQSFRRITMRTLAVTSALLMAATPPLIGQTQECAETTIPKTLPPAHEIVDSAGAITELREFNRLSGHMLFSLVFTDADSEPSVSPMQGADAQTALVLLRSVWPEKPTGTWALRVRVDADSATGTASLALERSIYCPPIPVRTSQPPRRVTVEIRPGDHRPAPGVTRVHISVEALIDEAGNVASARVTQSSGMADIDNDVVEQWQTKKFKPALIDGRPIRALYRSDRQSPKL